MSTSRCAATAHAGDRAREPRIPRQAGWTGGRLPRPRRSVEAGARDLHRERRQGHSEHRYPAGHRGHAGEARNRVRHDARLRLVELVRWHTGREDGAPSAGAGHVLEQENGKERFVQVVTDFRGPLPFAPATKKPSRFATTLASSRPSKPRSPNRAANGSPPINSTTPFGSSSPRPSRPKAKLSMSFRRRLASTDITDSFRPIPRRSPRTEIQERRCRATGQAAQATKSRCAPSEIWFKAASSPRC